MFLSFILLSFSAYFLFFVPPPSSVLTSRISLESDSSRDILHPEITNLVRRINVNNRKINNFQASVSASIWHRGVRYLLRGKLYYEKPSNFRLVLGNVFGREFDMGSNEKLFWYWSKREKERHVYYAFHSDYHKTRLKIPFHPVFIRESLGLDDIDLSSYRLLYHNKDYAVLCREYYHYYEGKFYRYIFLNKKYGCIEGFILGHQIDHPIAECIIGRSKQEDVPFNSLLYFWNQEEIIMKVSFVKFVENTTIDNDVWQMPDYDPRINMAED